MLKAQDIRSVAPSFARRREFVLDIMVFLPNEPIIVCQASYFQYSLFLFLWPPPDCFAARNKLRARLDVTRILIDESAVNDAAAAVALAAPNRYPHLAAAASRRGSATLLGWS
jgi:hypothetical protein